VEKTVDCEGCCGPIGVVPAPSDRESWSSYCGDCQSIIGAHRAQLLDAGLEDARHLLAQIDSDRVARQARIDAWEGHAARLYRESLSPVTALVRGVVGHTLDGCLWPPTGAAESRWVPRKRKQRRAEKKSR
jgi:hypothetical protein